MAGERCNAPAWMLTRTGKLSVASVMPREVSILHVRLGLQQQLAEVGSGMLQHRGGAVPVQWVDCVHGPALRCRLLMWCSTACLMHDHDVLVHLLPSLFFSPRPCSTLLTTSTLAAQCCIGVAEDGSLFERTPKKRHDKP
jgi:hypothetical protein